MKKEYRIFIQLLIALTLILSGCNSKVEFPSSGGRPTSISMNESGWVSYGPEAESAVLVSNVEAGIEINLSFNGCYAQSVENGGQSFIQASIPDTGLAGDVGDPELPFKGFYLDIPYGITPTISI